MAQVALSARPSSPEDRASVSRLLSEAIPIAADAPAVAYDFQRWKYWDPHPFFHQSRSRVLTDGASLVAHAGAWPLQLQGSFGKLCAIHLIDWAAARAAPGAGSRILKQSQDGVAAVFSVGGSAMSRKILPLLGFESWNSINFLQRPLRPLDPALHSSRGDWKTPARILRNLYRYALPFARLPSGWSAAPVLPAAIPESLFPRCSSDAQAISVRNSQLLEHILRCPLFQAACCYLLKRFNNPVAYLYLAAVRGQARLIDYGPDGLDTRTAAALGIAAQQLARSDFRFILDIVAATTEPSVAKGFSLAGFRLSRQEPIKILKLHPALASTNHFRLTLLDWDAACL